MPRPVWVIGFPRSAGRWNVHETRKGLVTPCHDFVALQELLEPVTCDEAILYSISSTIIHVADETTYRLLRNVLRKQAGRLSTMSHIKFHRTRSSTAMTLGSKESVQPRHRHYRVPKDHEAAAA